MSMKNSNDTIGNRTLDLPACSAVPLSTASPSTLLVLVYVGEAYSSPQFAVLILYAVGLC